VFDAFETTACNVLQMMEHFEVGNMIKHALRNLHGTVEHKFLFKRQKENQVTG
jgi:hypothetical protein